MSQLETYDWNDLHPVEEARTINPGVLVKHRSYPNSLGTCISRAWGADDKPMQVTVLWTKEPGKLSWPDARPVGMSLIAQELVKVQPMTGPLGSIFYMDYKYPSGSV